jgi:hypothetical protein
LFVKWGMKNCSGELLCGVKDSLQNGGVRCAEEVTQTDIRTNTCIHNTDTDTMSPTHTHTHTYTPSPTHTHTHTHTYSHTHPHTHKTTNTHNTHTNTHTPYQQSLIITQQQSLRQCHNCVTVFSVD